MNHLDWINCTSQFPEVQQKIEENCQLLIDIYFDPEEDYAIEKFLKFYSEGLRYLERLLLLQNGVAPENINNGLAMSADEVQEKQQIVKNQMFTNASRHFRHAITFLPVLKSESEILKAERDNFNYLEKAVEEALSPENARNVYQLYHQKRSENKCV